MITIRHAAIDEKRKTYEWLCLSDTAAMHMGKPDFPENPIPTWQEFQNDFEDFYYQQESLHLGSVMIIEKDGNEIGATCYACFHLHHHMAELDIWLKSKAYCGKGYGTEALKELINYLNSSLDTTQFIIRPSEKNIGAIKSYQKAGFRKIENKEEAINQYLLEKYLDNYGSGDYGMNSTAVLTLVLED
ncbi:GNAT family N-acetyltransferase [Dysgonomonas alginatilytica]|nr:GNAT family N-acetyltransferase [Dysgonomonas alginatilytica]